jgi:Ca2+-transporting ATPase
MSDTDLVVDGRPVRRDNPSDHQLLELLTAAVLCNDAILPTDRAAGSQGGLGDPTEVALLSAAASAGIDRRSAELEYPRIGELPFDSSRKRMTTIHRAGPRLLVCTKGAYETLRDDGVLSGTPELELRQVGEVAAGMAARGLRVLAIATGTAVHPCEELADYEHGLRLRGVVAVADPPRATARATVESCQRAGITLVLITGDHPATAREVANRVGILPAEAAPSGDIATGAQLGDQSITDLTAPTVFARTTPQQKLDIVTAWQHTGAIVAMTGDGVNDAPALHRADIGVAMGMRGTDVARIRRRT